MRIARLVRPTVVAATVWTIAVCLSGVLASAAAAETRVALVIGDSAYAHGGRLTNPANDAAAVAQSLRRVGFAVVLQTDLGRNDLEAALKSFTRASAGADIALVYFAGHGIEKGGTNYLIPVDATLASDADIDFEAVPLDLVMHAVSGATRLKVVILDACRNNPFRDAMRRTAATRGIGQGLAKPPDPEEGDMLVAYAAEAGSTAEDGTGANSPFATALARHLADPGVDIRIMFGRIRDDVRAATGMRQEPAVYESLGGEQFYMAAATSAGAGAQAIQNVSTPPDPRTMDLMYWQSVEASDDPAQLKAYLDQYPNGAFATLAKAKIAALHARGAGSRPGQPSGARGQAVGGQAVAIAAPATGPSSAGSTAQGPLVQAPAAVRPGPFDGPWRVVQTCPNPQDPDHPRTPPPFIVRVRQGRLHGARGMADQPGWMALDGVVGGDGAATLDAHGLTIGNPATGVVAGMPFRNVLIARFTPSGGAGKWMARTVCQFSFVRPPAWAAQAVSAAQPASP